MFTGTVYGIRGRKAFSWIPFLVRDTQNLIRLVLHQDNSLLPSLVEADRRFRVMMMEAVRTSETSVYFNEIIRRYIPEGCLSSSHSPPWEPEIPLSPSLISFTPSPSLRSPLNQTVRTSRPPPHTPVNSLWYTKRKQVDDDFGALHGRSATNTRNHGGDVKKETLEIYQKATSIMHQIIIIILAYLINV
jgi:hypothetical protein